MAVTQEGAFTTPQLYIPGQRNQPFSWRVLGTWLASAVWNSAVCFYVPVWALAPAAVSSTGLMIDIWATGTLGYTLIIVTVRAAHAALSPQILVELPHYRPSMRVRHMLTRAGDWALAASLKLTKRVPMSDCLRQSQVVRKKLAPCLQSCG